MQSNFDFHNDFTHSARLVCHAVRAVSILRRHNEEIAVTQHRPTVFWRCLVILDIIRLAVLPIFNEASRWDNANELLPTHNKLNIKIILMGLKSPCILRICAVFLDLCQHAVTNRDFGPRRQRQKVIVLQEVKCFGKTLVAVIVFGNICKITCKHNDSLPFYCFPKSSLP